MLSGSRKIVEVKLVDNTHNISKLHLNIQTDTLAESTYLCQHHLVRHHKAQRQLAEAQIVVHHRENPQTALPELEALCVFR